MAKEIDNPKYVIVEKTGLKIKFNPGALIASLVRSIADFGTGSLNEATLAEWAKALNIKGGKERQAYNLLAKSLLAACRTQIKHRLDQVDIDENENLVLKSTELRFEVFKALEQNDYDFNFDHLSDPTAFPLLQDFKPYYEEWLRDTFQMVPAQSEELAAEFPSYFAYELSRQLLTNGKEYEDLVKYCQNPFNEVTQRELARKQYRAELKKKYHQPALGEKLVALSDIYIEPGFLVFEKAVGKERREEINKDKERPQQGPFYKVGYPGSIHNYLLKHFIPQIPSQEINSERETGKLMVLLGQPGHGKSSFCYRCIHDLLNDPGFHGNAFFLRLQDADKTILEADIEQFAKLLPDSEAIGFADWVDKKHGQPNLLFLDGLDEFFMAQSPTDEEVVRFLRNCKKLVDKNPHLYIIVTSRLSYVEPHKLHQEDCLVLKLDVLNEEQQKTLLQNFTAKWQEDGCTLTDAQIEQINKEDNQKHIKELIELPILLQMVLMAKVPLESSASRAKIYDQLFEQVLQRKWDDNKRLKKYVREDSGFTKDDLREYLAFLAFKTFQGKKGYLRKSQVAEYKETKQFAKSFLRNVDDGQSMKQVLKDILTSFYLQESQKQSGEQPEADKEYNYVIEFMHKSLYEYLACEHIWQNTLDFFLETDKRGKVKTRSLEEVQKQMQETYATIRHTSETVDYMKEIIDNKREPHRALAEQMGIHFPGLLEEGFIFSYSADKHNEEIRFKPEQLVLNAFHTYWLIFGSLCLHEVEVGRFMETEWGELVARELNQEKVEAIVEAYHEEIEERKNKNIFEKPNELILELEKTDFSSWTSTLIGVAQMNGGSKHWNYEAWTRRYLSREHAFKVMEFQNKAISRNLDELVSYMRLASAERISMALNFQHFSLKGVELSGLSAYSIQLNGSNLYNANLGNTAFGNANFMSANLVSVYLGNTFLNYANLRNANLTDAYLGNAYLNAANLNNANLANAYLGNAYLNESILRNANLTDAYLGNAYLNQSNLGNAKLENAYLAGTSLWHANLWNANLMNSDLHNADLSGAILQFSILLYTKLNGANLTDAKLENAKVHDINWLKNLKRIGVIGATEVENKYQVNPEKQKWADDFGEEWEGYVIEKLESSDNESELKNNFEF